MPAGRREASRRLGVGRAPPGEDPAVLVEDADPAVLGLERRSVALRYLALVPPELRHVGTSLLVEDEVGRPLGIGPLVEILAVRAEDLDAIVLAIADEDAPVRGQGNAVRQEELAGTSARSTPGTLELATGRILVHAAIPVAVGDVEVALGPHCEIRRAVEGAARPRDGTGILAVVAGVGRLVHGAHGHEQLAVRRELAHGVIAV